MDINEFFQSENLITFFLKAFAVVFSFIFLIYAIVLRRQIKVMLRAVHVSIEQLLLTLGFIQILAAIFLLALAFIII